MNHLVVHPVKTFQFGEMLPPSKGPDIDVSWTNFVFINTKNLPDEPLRLYQGPERPVFALLELGILLPEVVSSEVDVLPRQGREVLE